MTGWEDDDVDIELEINDAFKKNAATSRSVEQVIPNGWDLDDFDVACNDPIAPIVIPCMSTGSTVHCKDGQVSKSGQQDDSFTINESSDEKIDNGWNHDEASNDLHTPMKYPIVFSDSSPNGYSRQDPISSKARNFLCESMPVNFVPDVINELGSYDPVDGSALKSTKEIVNELGIEKGAHNLEGWDEDGLDNLLTKETLSSNDLWSLNELKTSHDAGNSLQFSPQNIQQNVKTDDHRDENLPTIACEQSEVDNVENSDEHSEIAQYHSNIWSHPQFISEGGLVAGNDNEAIEDDLMTNNDIDHLQFISGTDHINPTLHQSEFDDNNSSIGNEKDVLDLSKHSQCEPPLISNLGWEVDDLEMDMSEDAEDELDILSEPSSEPNEDIQEKHISNAIGNNVAQKLVPNKTWLNGIFSSIQDIESKLVNDFARKNETIDHKFPKSKVVASEESFKDLLDKIAPNASNVSTEHRNRESEFSQYKSLFDKIARLPNLSPSKIQRSTSDAIEGNGLKELFDNLNGVSNDKSDEGTPTSPILSNRFVSGGVSVLGKISTSAMEITVIDSFVLINILIILESKTEADCS
jgi:hypothetical protein